MRNSKTYVIKAGLLFLLLLVSQVYAYQDDIAYTNPSNTCKSSKIAINSYEPKKFIPSNNLLRMPGKIADKFGSKVIIKGQLVDSYCVPIADAKIYIWHVDQDGKYPYKALRGGINKSLVQPSYESFVGNGVATTNNNGEFIFVTTMPGVVGGEAAHINLRAQHYRLGSIQTKFYVNYLQGAIKEENIAYTDEHMVDDAIDSARGKSTKKAKIILKDPKAEAENEELNARGLKMPRLKVIPGFEFTNAEDGYHRIKIVFPTEKNFQKY